MSKIVVKGLHGADTYSIDISKQVNIIIGENGTGKSTLINIFFTFMTKQWNKLIDYDFETIYIEDVQLEISKEDIIVLFNLSRRRNFREDHMYRSFIADKMLSYSSNFDYKEWEILLGNAEFSKSVLYSNNKRLNKKELAKLESSRIKIDRFLKFFDETQFVLLPTYRRIEKEIERFLPKDKEGDLKEEKIVGNNSKIKYIEIYGSGMSDVDTKINDYIAKIRESFHSELNSLIQSYIKDIINRRYDSSSDELSDSIENISIQDLSRYLTSSFDDSEIDKIIGFINDYRILSKDKENVQFSYFIGKLVKLYNSQLERERPLIDLFNMCNSYFNDLDKVSFLFDRDKFTYNIVKNRNNKIVDLKLSDLSSGQKQIVSIFSHLYLGDQHSYYLVIDEPELSISVDWQKRILNDIYASSYCKGILAVTHSPFIFDNDLIRSVSSIHDLRENL